MQGGESGIPAVPFAFEEAPAPTAEAENSADWSPINTETSRSYSEGSPAEHMSVDGQERR